MGEIPQENRSSVSEGVSGSEAKPLDPALPLATSFASSDEEPSVDVSTLLGPSSVPAPLLEPAPKDEHGRVDWARLHALVTAVEALVAAGMTSEARPLLGQLRGIVEAARGPSAKVFELSVERSRRET